MFETVVYGGLEWELLASRERELTFWERFAVSFEHKSELPEKREMTFREHHERLAQLSAIHKLPGSESWRGPYLWEVNRLYIDGVRNRLNPQQMRLWHDMFSHDMGEWYDIGLSKPKDVLILHYSSFLDAQSQITYRKSMRFHVEDCFTSDGRRGGSRGSCLGFSYFPVFDATPLFSMFLYNCFPEQLPCPLPGGRDYIQFPTPDYKDLDEKNGFAPLSLQERSLIFPAGHKDGYCIGLDEKFASRGVRELKSYSDR
ncbi:hypothetical protein HZC31_03910 [Candidatus Woesearchaeota archaeon]|nr:hypothetical protein [Candidatus Woesearchaeota archaeon]